VLRAVLSENGLPVVLRPGGLSCRRLLTGLRGCCQPRLFRCVDLGVGSKSSGQYRSDISRGAPQSVFFRAPSARTLPLPAALSTPPDTPLPSSQCPHQPGLWGSTYSGCRSTFSGLFRCVFRSLGRIRERLIGRLGAAGWIVDGVGGPVGEYPPGCNSTGLTVLPAPVERSSGLLSASPVSRRRCRGWGQKTGASKGSDISRRPSNASGNFQ